MRRLWLIKFTVALTLLFFLMNAADLMARNLYPKEPKVYAFGENLMVYDSEGAIAKWMRTEFLTGFWHGFILACVYFTIITTMESHVYPRIFKREEEAEEK